MKYINTLQRLLAALLALGGALGVVVGVLLALFSVSEGWRGACAALLLAAVCALPCWAGSAMWRGSACARRWAIALYATQIPIIHTPWLAVHWFSGLSVGVVWAAVGRAYPLRLTYGLGLGGELEWATVAGPTAVGLNLFALLALVILVTRPLRTPSASVTQPLAEGN